MSAINIIWRFKLTVKTLMAYCVQATEKMEKLYMKQFAEFPDYL